MTENKNIKNIARFGFLATVTLFLACGSPNQDKACSQFRNGKFIFRLRGQQGHRDTKFLIIRDDSTQTETDEESGNTSKLAIKWTDNCSYELTLIESTFSFPDSIRTIRQTVPIKNKILSSTDDYYIFQAKRDNSAFIMTDTLWIDK